MKEGDWICCIGGVTGEDQVKVDARETCLDLHW